MTVRSVILTAVALMAIAAVITLVRPSTTNIPPLAATPSTATTAEVRQQTPPPTPPSSTQASQTAATPSATPSTGEAADVRRFVARFAAAFARPTTTAQQQRWNHTVPAYLDESTRAAVSTLTAAMVPYEHVTGTPTVTTSQFPHRASVPTDAGDLVITVCRDHSGEPGQPRHLLVCGIEMEHDQ